MVNTAEIIPQNFIPWSGNLRIIVSKFTVRGIISQFKGYDFSI